MAAVLLALHLTPGRRLSATISQWLGLKLKDPAKRDGVMATLSDLLKANPWSCSLQDLAREDIGCLPDDDRNVLLNSEIVMVNILARLAWSLDIKVKDMAHRQEAFMVRMARSEGCTHSVQEQPDMVRLAATLPVSGFEWESGRPGDRRLVTEQPDWVNSF